MQKFTIKDFNKQFPSEVSCLNTIFQMEHADKPCPKCRKLTNFYKLNNRKCYSCQNCRHQIHPLAGTIFHKSSTSLKSWFYAIFLMSQSKNGVAATELQRLLGVTYKCAWRMGRQIRTLMAQKDDPLEGIVEMDEAYIGGKRKGPRGRGAANKTPVVGMVERSGRIRAVIEQTISSMTLTKIIEANISKEARIITDDLPAYQRMEKHGYKHESVNHSAYEYVRGDVHTNTIEGFWSQLKRSLRGTHHSVSPLYLKRYLDEFVYRYNHRNSDVPLFPLLLKQASQRASEA